MGFWEKLFGKSDKPNMAELVKGQAIILDVRTKAEYASGHVKGSQNIPLDQLGNRLGGLKKEKPIVTCCASGMRSGSAARILKRQGYNAYNGGSWQRVQQLKQR